MPIVKPLKSSVKEFGEEPPRSISILKKYKIRSMNLREFMIQDPPGNGFLILQDLLRQKLQSMMPPTF